MAKTAIKKKAKSYDTPLAANVNVDHTKRAYLGLADAYTYFNEVLFNKELPSCVITMQRKKGALGYHVDGRFMEGDNIVTEIALNPSTFNSRTKIEVLSTLVHEMAHLWQYKYGKPGKKGYHNTEWGFKMKELGLWPSDTGKDGGKEVGTSMSHYIIKDGAFAISCDKFLALGEFALYSDRVTDEGKKTAKKKAESKTKFTCNECDANAWGKPSLNIICGACDCRMEIG